MCISCTAARQKLTGHRRAEPSSTKFEEEWNAAAQFFVPLQQVALVTQLKTLQKNCRLLQNISSDNLELIHTNANARVASQWEQRRLKTTFRASSSIFSTTSLSCHYSLPDNLWKMPFSSALIWLPITHRSEPMKHNTSLVCFTNIVNTMKLKILTIFTASVPLKLAGVLSEGIQHILCLLSS